MKGRNSSVISIRVSDSVYTTLEELAGKRGMTVPAFVKRTVENFAGRVNHSVNTTDSVNTKPAQDDVKLGQGSQNDVKLEQPAQPSPWYNPAIHPPGTLVLTKQGKRIVEAIVPDLDGDGHVVPW